MGLNKFLIIQLRCRSSVCCRQLVAFTHKIYILIFSPKSRWLTSNLPIFWPIASTYSITLKLIKVTLKGNRITLIMGISTLPYTKFHVSFLGNFNVQSCLLNRTSSFPT